MRAARYKEFGGPICVETVARPSAPPGGVVLQVKATGVCRSDWHGWKGHDSDIATHGLPFTPGHELSGVVAELGEGVDHLRVGDRVAVPFILSCGRCRECARSRTTVCEAQEQPGFTMHGSFAEYVALPRAEHLCRLPDAVSHVEAAALGCRFTTAYRAVVQRGRLGDGDVMAVFGCGGLGLSAVMIGAAVTQGARIIAIDVSERARAKALELGASAVVDASRGSEHVRAELRALTDGVGADLALDCAGFRATCEDAVWSARRGGRVVQVGLPIGAPLPEVPMARVANQELEILGSHGLAAVDMPSVLSLVEAGKLRPSALVEREVSLEDGARAITEMDHGSPVGMTIITSFA
jgi:alcohol dehydrogenase